MAINTHVFGESLDSELSSSQPLTAPWRGLNFGFGRDVPQGIWKWTHTNTNFWRKSDPFIYQSAWFWANFGSNLSDFFSSSFLKFEPIFLKFRTILKIDPFKYQIFHKMEIIDIPGGWFCYPCLCHDPVGFFLPSPSPPGTAPVFVNAW